MHASTRCAWTCWLVLLVAAALALPSDVHAAPLRAHLSWSHPPASQCPSAEAVELAVEELAGHQVFVPRAEADVLVEGGAQDGSGSARAWFSARRADGTPVGERELLAEPGQCAALTGTLALVLSILLDRPEDEPSALGVYDARATSRWLPRAAGVFVGVRSGATPRVAVGGGPELLLAPHRSLQVRLDASYWGGGMTGPRGDGDAGIGVRWSLLSGGLAACPVWPGGGHGWSLRACLGGQLGSLRARPRGLDGPPQLARLLAQLGAELGASLRVQRLTTLALSLGAAVALTRPTFFYDRADDSTVTLHRPERLSLFARVSLTIGPP